MQERRLVARNSKCWWRTESPCVKHDLHGMVSEVSTRLDVAMLSRVADVAHLVP
jgi:hypothetical protein